MDKTYEIKYVKEKDPKTDMMRGWYYLYFNNATSKLYDYIDGPRKHFCDCIYNLFWVRLGDKYGLLNEKFEEIVPCIYDYIAYDTDYLHSKDECSILYRTNKNEWEYNAIDIVNPFLVNSINIPPFYSSTYNLIRVFKNGKWGYVSGDGKIVIPCEYDIAKKFRNGFAAVKKDNKYYYIDYRGSKVIPCITSMPNDIYFDSDLEFVRIWYSSHETLDENSVAFINKKGELLIPDFFRYFQIHDDGIIVNAPQKMEIERSEYFINFDLIYQNIFIDNNGEIKTIFSNENDNSEYKLSFHSSLPYNPRISKSKW